MQINCIVIDDEPLARNTIESYIKKIPSLVLLGSFENPLEAFHILDTVQVDLIISDIQMPDMTGIEFLKVLKNPPFAIFITAHPQFAVEGFELEVLDYIVKPYSLERFAKAIQRAQKGIAYRYTKSMGEDEYLKVKDGNKTIFLKYNDIDYIEGMKDYVKIHNINKSIVTMTTLKSLEQLLPKEGFIRVQKSYIINIKKIVSVESSKVILTLNRFEIPIGLLYRNELFRRLQL